MGTYDRQIVTAKRAIVEKGGRFTWRKVGITPDVVDPWKETPALNVDYPNIPILIVPEKIQLDDFIHAVKGTEIKTGRQKGIMAQVPFVPDPADVVIDAYGVIWQIDSIDKLAPNVVEVILWYIIFKG